MLRDSILVVHTCPPAKPLTMKPARKSIHGLSFLSYMSMVLCLVALLGGRKLVEKPSIDVFHQIMLRSIMLMCVS